jgi:DNA-binding response OmpR family regulator
LLEELVASRVLVIEDDESIRAALAEALDLEGYAVETAANGALALDKVRVAQPDVIILDLMMPVMDGWAFMKACRSEALCAGIPVLVTSAYRKLAETAPELHVQACLAKPFDLDVLLGAVERLLRRGPAHPSVAEAGV